MATLNTVIRARLDNSGNLETGWDSDGRLEFDSRADRPTALVTLESDEELLSPAKLRSLAQTGGFLHLPFKNGSTVIGTVTEAHPHRIVARVDAAEINAATGR